MRYIILLILTFNLSTFSWAQDSLTKQINDYKKQGSKKKPAAVKKIMTKALVDLKATGIDSNVIKKAPVFSLSGKKFSTFYKNKPVVLKFYRGHWCPYCQLELKSYQSYKEKIEAKGYQLIVITPDQQKYIDRFKKKMKITIPIYSDKNNSIAKKFGITFKLSKDLSTLYKKFGIDLKKSQGNSNNELPLPGTYIVNTKGIITYAFIDADYTKRLDPIDLLKKL
jgi:peroxiredoxin